MKSYTDIEQSKRLAEILPFESADMCYIKREINNTFIETPIVKPIGGVEKSLCCWSLAALLDVLPKSLIYTPNQALDGYCCKNIMHDLETYGENPIDACVEMILKLNEENLL